jgi:hypothetical protein
MHKIGLVRRPPESRLKIFPLKLGHRQLACNAGQTERKPAKCSKNVGSVEV